MTNRTRGQLTRDEIIAAALGLIDELGADQFTMRKLGERLGVDPMAVYHHVPNKRAILDGIVELLWQGVEVPVTTEGESWQDVLTGLFVAFRARLLEHPRAIAIVGTRPVTTPAMLDLVDVTLGRLAAAGLTGGVAMPLVDNLAGFTIGKCLAEVSMYEEGAVQRVQDAIATVTPETHPHLVSTMAGGYEMLPEEQFHRGLRAMIEGWPLVD